MADPQDSSSSSLLSRGDFAAALRMKYPTLAVDDDDDLVDAYLIKRPELSARVSPIPLRDAAAGAGVKPRLPGDPGEGLPAVPAPPPGKGGYRPDVGVGGELAMPTLPEAVVSTLASVPKGAAKAVRGTATAVGRGLGVTPMGKTLDEALRPAADMVTGGMEAGAPLLVPELAAAPGATTVALATGTALAEGVKWLTQQAGMPPSAVELVSAVSGVLGGVKAAQGMHGWADQRAMRTNIGRMLAPGTPGAANQAPPGVDLPLSRGANEAARWGAARAGDAHLAAEGEMRGELADETSKVESERVHAVAAASAAKADVDGKAHQSALEFLDSVQFKHKQLGGGFATPPPVEPEVVGRVEGQPIYGRDVVSEVPSGTYDPTTGEYRAPQTMVGAPPDVQVEGVGSAAPVVAQPSYPEARVSEVEQIGAQLEEGLGRAPGKPRLSPQSRQAVGERAYGKVMESRVKLAESQAFEKRRASIVEDMSGELDNVRHTKGRLHADVNTGESYFTPPQAGSEIYWQVVGDKKSPPTRAVIGDVVRAYAKTGAKMAKELPADLSGLGLEKSYGPREFHNAYNEFASKVAAVADKRTKAAVAREAWWDSQDSAAFKSEKVEPQEQAAALTGEEPAALGEGAPPMSAKPAGGVGEMPDFLQGLEADPSVTGGWEPEEQAALGESEPPLPGVEPARYDQPPVAELPAQSFSLTPPAAPEARQASLLERATGAKPLAPDAPVSKAAAKAAASGTTPSFWEMVKGEEGHLVLNVKPGNKRGLADWLTRNEDEHGDSGWFQEARRLLDEDNPKGAYRVALLGVGEVNAGELVGAAVKGAKDEKRGAKPISQNRDISGIPAAKILAAAEENGPLPKGTTVGAGGVLKMPGNPGGLDPKFSDLTLGRNLVVDMMSEIDANAIVRVEDAEGHLDQRFVSEHPEMRITAQMADQYLTSIPDYVVDSLHELTGLDRAGLGAHFKRAYSQAGKLLNAAKQWQDKNWDAILHLDPLTGSTAGPGAAGRLEFIDPARAKLITDYLNGERPEGLTADETSAVLKDMRRLTPKQLESLGFKMPVGAEVEGDSVATKQARTYVSNWLRQQRHMVEVGKRIEQIAQDANIDRTLLKASLGVPEKGGAKETAEALMRARLSFLISQSSTALHVFLSQSAQYQIGVFEEVLNAGLASVVGDAEGAREYWTLAKQMQKNWGAKGSVPMGALKHPTSDGIKDLYEMSADILQTAKPGDVRLMLKQLADYPDLEQHMLGTLMAHEARAGEKPHVPKNPLAKFLTSSKLGNALSVGMRVQEAANRTAVADAIVRTKIRMRGDDPEAVLREEGGLTNRYGEDGAREILGAATARALYMSQAGQAYADPITGRKTGPKIFIDMLSNWAANPSWSGAASLVVPFPKYAFGGGPRWLWDRLPGSLMADIARWKAPIPAGTPRIQLGLERATLERDVLPRLHAELGTSEWHEATAIGDHHAAQGELAELAKEVKSLERKYGQAVDAPGAQDLYGQFTKAAADMHAAAKRVHESADRAKTAAQEVTSQKKLLKDTSEKVGRLQEIAAPNWQEAISRQTTGALLLAGAYALRAAQPADTKWSQIAVGDKRVDMKWTGPFAAYMLMGDLLHDMHKHTDWSQFADEWDKSKDERAYTRFTGALKKAYSGKYTAGPLLRDATEAFLSLNGALGGTSAVIDTFLGKSESGGVLDAPIDLALAAVGQSIGSFTFPLRQFGDVLGTAFEAESKQRVPEEAGPKGSFAKELTQPALENIPGARQLITPKVDPFTGDDKQNPLGGMKPFTGVNPQIDAPLQKELNKTGLGYSKVAPHTTGDREFDNLVARQFGPLVRRLLPQLTENPTYKSMPPELQRDQLAKFMGKIRKAAYGLTAQQLSAEGEAAGGPPEAQVSGGAKVQKALGTGAGQKALAQKYRKWAIERAAAEGEDEPPDAEPTDAEPTTVSPSVQ